MTQAQINLVLKDLNQIFKVSYFLKAFKIAFFNYGIVSKIYYLKQGIISHSKHKFSHRLAFSIISIFI